ncbi:hypothetical protein [Parasphingorhabdus sp.]|uniref:hypothetical protein n=2 Tax=Parasphingorhabdus sp. TaxID=2709688 RepID=UPI0032644A1E
MKDTEHTKSALLNIRKMEKIKVSVLGQCYSTLGNVIWQILCEIYLRTIEDVDFSGRDLAQSILVSETLTKRFIAVLQAEGLIISSGATLSALDDHLSLTELGVSKVSQIIEESASETSHATDTRQASVFFA